jgi:Zn-dependent protease
MPDIAKLVQKLQTGNRNARYDACEELRVSPSLPKEALQALRLAASDPDQLIAGAATRALAVHTESAAEPPRTVNVELLSRPRPIGERPTVQDVAKRLSELENPRKSLWRTLLVPALSLLLFVSLGLLANPIVDLGILIAVLLIHELGHFVAMTYFGYRDVRVFFIPLFGAAVTGRPADVSTAKRSVVYLAGPVPGLVLGWPLMILGVLLDSQFVIQTAVSFVFINAFNLLPLIPLDGGRVLNEVAFSRNRHIEAAFNLLAGGALAIAAFVSGDIILGFLGIIVLLSIRYSWKIRSLSEKLQQEQEFGPHFSLLDAPQEIIDLVITSVLDNFPRVRQLGTLANLSSSLWSQLQATPPKLLPTVAILASYVATWAMTLVLIFFISLQALS